MTERAITDDPATLLTAAEACRGSGWGVALDDVGAEPASLAVMPFVHPDVVKVDRHLTQQPGGAYAARVVNAIVAYAERTGAAVLAEGVETREHVAAALGMGATLGQGWLFGRPGPLPADVAERSATLPVPFVAPPAGTGTRTPYEIVAARRPTAEATKRMLMPLSRYLEEKALDPAEPPILLGCFQEARFLTAATVRRYATVGADRRAGRRSSAPRCPAHRCPACRRCAGPRSPATTRCAASGTWWSSARTSPALSSRATSPTTDPTPTGGSPTPSRTTGAWSWRRPVRCCTGSCQHRRL